MSRTRWPLVLAATAAMARPGAFARAAEVPPPPSSEAKFEALVREIGVLRSDLDRLDRGERSTVKEIDRLQVEAALRSRELAKLSVQRSRTLNDLSESRSKLDAVRGEIRAGEQVLARHLREVYEMGRLREVRMILSLTEPVDVMRAVAYLDVVARRQSGAIDLLRRKRAQAEALEGSLDEQALSLNDLAQQSRARTEQLEGIRRQSAALLASIRQEREANRRAISEFTRAAEELETAIVSGHSNGRGTQGGPLAPGLDVSNLRGALEWPVPGIVKVPFGEIRNPKFGTVTPHPGIDIETEAATPIRAILGGRVVFSRSFSGYGNTVLVDHGRRYLSVYARAAVLDVVEGQEVLPGQALGVSAEQAFDNGPPIVYFEFRHEGRAVDPTLWLKKRSTAARKDMR